MPDAPFRYKFPPIIERVVSVRAKMNQGAYEQSYEDWKELAEKEFPIYEPLKQWLLNIQEKDGIPTEISPELEITPRFSEKTSKKGFGWSIRCPADQLTMNMHSNHHENRGYTELKNRFTPWLKKWAKHFQVTEYEDLTVHYVNLLDKTTLPSFAKDDFLDIVKVLNIFFIIPGNDDIFTPPLDCRVTIKLSSQYEGRLTIHAANKDRGSGPALSLDLIVNTKLNPGVNADEILDIMDWCHDRILERFEMIFTEAAKKSFQPVFI